ncbi:hypothetical protein ANCCAN_15594 [Ancylostoma caninum]|uniref:G-protein coupled receptors family 1 profile domain-containing protein n=1 Tax=Ancylostoma caninum TaxID=29170 RepID=A0A368G2A4_ANCCA|nr:hypothetical protein ANCCAN_15594 [Ancylostoma caninum]
MKSGNVTVLPNSTTAWEEQIRIVVGCVIFLSNMLLLESIGPFDPAFNPVFLNMHAPMRRQYVFFTLVAVGDILDSMYLIYPSIMRMMEIDACTFWEETTLWECTSKGYMMLRIYGTELVSLTMLVMTAEKLLAVFLPVIYRCFTYQIQPTSRASIYFRGSRLKFFEKSRTDLRKYLRNTTCIATPTSRHYVTNTARFIAALACLLICLLSLTTMILTSFFNPRNVIQQNKYCGISGSVVNGFAQFHHFFILSCQIGAFLGSGFAFLVAKNIRKRANKVELSSIRPILVVSFISCIVVSSNNMVR